MNDIDFSLPRRQSYKGLLLFFLNSVKIFLQRLWPLLVIYILKNKDLPPEFQLYSFFALAFIIVLILLNAILSFLNFYFYISNNEFVVKKGYLKKVKQSIPFERIQTVNTSQNILQQILNIVTFEIDTAGSANKELKIIALPKDVALSLQNMIANINLDKLQNAETQEDILSEKEESTIIQLNTFDLFKIGISENHLKSLLVIYLFLSGIYQQLSSLFKKEVDTVSENAETFLASSGMIILTILAIFAILAGIIFSIISTILKYYELKLFKKDGSYHLNSGLINKKALVIPFSKIQMISWSSNPLRKLMNFLSIEITQATAFNLSKKQEIRIPGCSYLNKQFIFNEIFKENEDKIWTHHRTLAVYFVRRWLFIGLLPSMLGLGLLFIFELPYLWFLPLLWITGIALWNYLAYKKRSFRICDNMIEILKGTVGKNVTMLYNYKIQAIRFRQSWYQQRHKIASVRIYTAGGKSLNIPFIEENLARELYNYLLFTTESSNLKWM